MRYRGPLLLLTVLGLSLLSLLVGCGGLADDSLTVLAGSELKDLEPLFDEIRKNTGLSLEMEYIGTLDGAERLLAGDGKVDLAWFSHAKYLDLLQGRQGKSFPQERIMLSPVVLGVKEGKAAAWGWIDNPEVTWREIVAKARAGELRYAMTNPASSNSGFTALVGAAAALAGSSDSLRLEDIDQVSGDLQGFFKGQVLTAGSSGWLAEAYLEEQNRLDGLVNYESVLLALNRDNLLAEELILIYPAEGIITADYPLMLVNEERREDYDTLVAYLRSPEFQRLMMESTLRRPAIPEVRPSSAFPSELLVELPFPNSLDVVDALLFSYLDEQRVPSHAVFVLDVSGSMKGKGLEELKTALNNLTGMDASLTGQFARFRDRERITLMVFSDEVQGVRDFDVDLDDGQTLMAIRDHVDALRARGGTAIYGSLAAAYYLVQEAQQQDPGRYYSIVLMSDGENTTGLAKDKFLTYYSSLAPETQGVKTFTVLFGDADRAAMEEIAAATGGRVFDAQTESLALVFKQIRGYQ